VKRDRSRTLTREESDALGRELDAIRREVVASLGQRDVDHIRRVIRVARHAGGTGRLLLHAGVDPLSFLAGVGALAAAKILENMEVSTTGRGIPSSTPAATTGTSSAPAKAGAAPTTTSTTRTRTSWAAIATWGTRCCA
jgi:hypothetical protein